VIAVLSPQLVVLGGGIGTAPPLLPLVRREVLEVLNGYVRAPEIVPPTLGDRAGVLGAIALAQAL
jgi:fructokinase